ncbi:MAG: 2-phospho-L-lactate transferase, partial [Actinobacteria bacterium]|nr:2-phospho-L-lactate transferase [Actinomycetota bacterium]
AIGVETSASAVAAHYGARNDGGVLDNWLLAEEDADLSEAVAARGIRPLVAPLWMSDLDASAAIVETALSAAGR